MNVRSPEVETISGYKISGDVLRLQNFLRNLCMPKKQATPPAVRKPRADAQRNRERILEVARLAFSRHGAEASLDDIARQAGIGPGTLCLRFPTRDALIEAVYHS